MDRRDFLKGAGAFVLLCAAGWKGLTELEKSLTPTVDTAVGPLLERGLELTPTLKGADVTFGGQLMFQVNEAGAKMLRLADGGHSLDRIIKEAGMEHAANDASLFFVTLGRAGYLQNRVEVMLYET